MLCYSASILSLIGIASLRVECGLKCPNIRGTALSPPVLTVWMDCERQDVTFFVSSVPVLCNILIGINTRYTNSAVRSPKPGFYKRGSQYIGIT